MATRMWAAAVAMLAGAEAAASAPEPNGDWVEVHQHARGPVSLDRSSVQLDGQILLVRSRTILNEAQPDGTKIMIVRYRYDCGARTADLLAFATLASDGRTIQEGELPAEARQAQPIGAGSPNETITNQLCP